MALQSLANEDTAVNPLQMISSPLMTSGSMLLSQSFAVLVRPVNSASVVPREHPFFDPGASTSVMFAENTGSGLAQTASVSSQLKATQPVRML